LRDLAADHQVLYLTTSDRYDSVADSVVVLPGPTLRDDLLEAPAPPVETVAPVLEPEIRVLPAAPDLPEVAAELPDFAPGAPDAPDVPHVPNVPLAAAVAPTEGLWTVERPNEWPIASLEGHASWSTTLVDDVDAGDPASAPDATAPVVTGRGTPIVDGGATA
jgi:hypothetical protein